ERRNARAAPDQVEQTLVIRIETVPRTGMPPMMDKLATGFVIVGPEPQGAFIGIDGSAKIAQLACRITEIVASFGKVVLQRKGALKGFFRFLETALGKQGRSHVVVNAGMRRR